MKRIISLFLVLVLICAMIPAVFAAEDSKGAAYQAYYDYLQEEISGLGGPVREEDYYRMFTDKIVYPSITEKILAVHLVDVTNDGIEELIIKRCVTNQSSAVIDSLSTEWICIYTYVDDQIVRIGQTLNWTYSAGNNSWGYYEPEGFIGNVLSSHQFPYISNDCLIVCKGADGKTYLADSQPTAGLEGSFSIYGFNGTRMEKLDYFAITFLPSWDFGIIESNYGQHYHEINRNHVSEAEFKNKMNAYIQGGTYALQNNNYTDVLYTLSSYMDAYYTPSYWAVEEVNAAIDLGYVPSGLQEDYTSPITRSEFCSLAVRLYESYTGQEITERLEFDDTADEDVQKMGALGVVNGMGNNLFAPDDLLTRQQAATILARLSEVMGAPLPAGPVVFSDSNLIADWASVQVGQVFAAGVMNGVGQNCFDPLNSYTREQAILTVLRLSNAIG